MLKHFFTSRLATTRAEHFTKLFDTLQGEVLSLTFDFSTMGLFFVS